MAKNKRKNLKNDSRSAEYASVAKSLRTSLGHNSSTPFFAQPLQIIGLQKRCEQIIKTKAYALPTEHTIEGSQQYMMAFWCKLKVMEAEQLQKKNGGIIVAGSLDDDSSEEEDDDDDDDNGSSSDDDSNVPSKGRGGGGGGGGGSGGGGGGGRKRKAGGRDGVGKKKGGERKSSRSHEHNNIKEEASRKLEPVARKGGGIVSLLSQASD
jgi:hypothetical protein